MRGCSQYPLDRPACSREKVMASRGFIFLLFGTSAKSKRYTRQKPRWRRFESLEHRLLLSGTDFTLTPIFFDPTVTRAGNWTGAGYSAGHDSPSFIPFTPAEQDIQQFGVTSPF